MRLRICLVGLLLAVLAGSTQPVLAQQSADPLSGTWKGDWGAKSNRPQRRHARTQVGRKGPCGYRQPWSRCHPD